MTLENLKDFWRDISLKHKDVQQFDVGSWYDAATHPYTSQYYPLCFWEMPYTINYNQEFSKTVDTVTCSLSVFLTTKVDDIADSHQAISIAKSIGDAIVTKARLTATDFSIQSVNAVTVREYSDDYVSGVRYDITILLKRDICEAEINTYFNDCE
jgi:hypothetical protein